MTRRRSAISGFVALLVAGALLAVIVAGGSASKGKRATPVAGSALATRRTSLGNVLVDADGRTLYLFEGDRTNRSTLSAAGLRVWPAFTSLRKPKALDGLSAAHLATVDTHGHLQVSYYGHPLYYFVGDSKAGQTSGQGLLEFGALWYVVAPNGGAVTRAASAAPAESAKGYAY
jgi:predicted lipoprotein with Yx(FWY)xxD motif